MIDLTGQTFGRLKVLKKDANQKSSRGVYWICECECKNICSICGVDLRKGDTKSCGCLQKERRHEKRIDISGQIFIFLKVLEYDEEKSFQLKQTYWKCQCLLCGNIKTIKGSHIKEGSIKSCGCLKSSFELQIAQVLIDNDISFKREYSFPDLKGDKRLLFFDFAIFNNNELKYLIEYQGEQHYQEIAYYGGEEAFLKRKYYDKLKEDYCLEHKYPLIILNKNNKLIKEEIIKEELLK